MNVADSRRLASALERQGCTPATRVEEADVVVLNTCVVRQAAEDKVYGRLGSLRPLKQRRPEMVIGLMGCLVGMKDHSALRRRFPWVDVFLPPSESGPLLAHLAERGMGDEDRSLEPDTSPTERVAESFCQYGPQDQGLLLPSDKRGRLVSAYVPAVLGCSHGCTYCIIPYRRGPERSRAADEILAEVNGLVAQGVREITLLGQIVDRYGYDLVPGLTPQVSMAKLKLGTGQPETPLVGLLRRIHEIDGLERIRFLTSHPNWMTDELIDTVAELEKVCEHIEVPVQAGNDEILTRMKRGYTVDDYRRLVDRIRARIQGVSIATDAIVGFPGETEVQFQHTYDLLAELRLDKAHIARYSPRSQTLAARHFHDDVSPEEKKRRRKALDDLQAEILAEINGRLLGETIEVLVAGRKKGRWWGRTRTDKLVFFEDGRDWLGQLVRVRITWAGPWSLIGGVSGHHSAS